MYTHFKDVICSMCMHFWHPLCMHIIVKYMDKNVVKVKKNLWMKNVQKYIIKCYTRFNKCS